MSLAVQLEIVRCLKKMAKKDSSLGGEGLDGLRVMRTLSRMRALKKNLRSNPRRIIRQHDSEWAEDIGGEHKAWTWRDVSDHISWGKFRSMKRVYTMLGAVKRELEIGPENAIPKLSWFNA